MIYLGIDPGHNGGLAFIRKDGSATALDLFKTPVIGGRDYDVQVMKQLLRRYQDVYAVIENQISMPGQGLTSTLQTGKGFGIWLGLLAGCEIAHQVVSAKQWQTKLFSGTSPKLDTKARSEIVAKRLFPSADFRRSERAVKADDGLTDAACIAEYGRRLMGEFSAGVQKILVPHVPLGSTPEICRRCGRYIPGDSEGCVTN